MVPPVAPAVAARGTGGDATWLTPPPMPPALVVPAGATGIHAHAVGAQIYTCTASGGADTGATTYARVSRLRTPLYDESGVQVETHGPGRAGRTPTEASPTGRRWPSRIHRCRTRSRGLLRVASTSGTGAFSDVTYVQRLSTTGGKAPATGCDSTTVGTDTRADYMADYYFYRGGAGAAWLVPPMVPDAIALPMAMTLKLHDHGTGMQIYACLAAGGAGGAATFAWIPTGPDALLVDPTFYPVAREGAGPSWTSADGSVMTARELARLPVR